MVLELVSILFMLVEIKLFIASYVAGELDRACLDRNQVWRVDIP